MHSNPNTRVSKHTLFLIYFTKSAQFIQLLLIMTQYFRTGNMCNHDFIPKIQAGYAYQRYANKQIYVDHFQFVFILIYVDHKLSFRIHIYIYSRLTEIAKNPRVPLHLHPLLLVEQLTFRWQTKRCPGKFKRKEGVVVIVMTCVHRLINS